MINYLTFIAELNAGYVPTPENAISYLLRITTYLIISAIEGAVVSVVIGLVKDRLEAIFHSLAR